MTWIAESGAGRLSRGASIVFATLPGMLLCGAIGTSATILDSFEIRWLGRSWLEALVLAIILGTAVRTAWTPGARWESGIKFSAKTLLEIAVMILGVTISAQMVVVGGPALLAGIFGVVCVSLVLSYGIGRLFGIPPRMAMLIACGNSICGNSAIAVVAPVIGATSKDIATSIAFTAVLGVAVVVGLPLVAVEWNMTPEGFGVFAGLTVYAVPQVLAATAPISSLSAQVGTLVKLVRVLMLGPLVLALSLFVRAQGALDGTAPAATATDDRVKRRLPLHQLVPWFITGFLLLIAARSSGIVPSAVAEPASRAASVLTIISMAALGLGVDIRVIAKAGPRVTAVITLSLVSLGAIALMLIRALGLS
jgi:uncharacterized integral membrane protein (TIGR00698 family)